MIQGSDKEIKVSHLHAVICQLLEVANSAHLLSKGLQGLSTFWVIWVYGGIVESDHDSVFKEVDSERRYDNDAELKKFRIYSIQKTESEELQIFKTGKFKQKKSISKDKHSLKGMQEFEEDIVATITYISQQTLHKNEQASSLAIDEPGNSLDSDNSGGSFTEKPFEFNEDDNSSHHRVEDDLKSPPSRKSDEEHKAAGMLYQCAECKDKFDKEASLKSHVENENHSGGKCFQCSKCGISFKFIYRLTLHTRVHTGLKPFICSKCGRTFAVKCTLISHERTHDTDNPYKCEHCPQSYASNADLEKHLEYDHGKPATFPCEICYKTIATYKGFIVHMRRHEGRQHCCGTCDKAFYNKIQLEKHKLIAHSDVYDHEKDGQKLNLVLETNGELKAQKACIYKCKHCDKLLPYKYCLKEHELIHKGIRPYMCSKCNKSFPTKTRLKSHNKYHNPHYKCDECGVGFPYLSRLVDHQKIHTGAKPFSCDVCKRSFAHQSYLSVHLRKMHGGEKPYTCDECGKSFLYQNMLTIHQRTHSRVKLFQCTICNKSLSTKACLHSHMSSFHGGEDGIPEPAPKSFQCPQCGKMFGLMSSLRNHMLRHSGVRKFRCTVCGKACVTKHDLELHYLTHSDEKPFQCFQCGKSFRQAGTLKMHEMTHTEVKQFECDICLKTFSHKDYLKRHKVLHEGTRNYKCEMCDKAFPRRSDLNKHVRTHTGLKPFQCEFCSRLFAISWNLKVHLKTVHKDEKQQVLKRGESLEKYPS